MSAHSFRLVPAAYLYLLRDSGAGPEVLLQLRRNTGFRDGHWAAAASGHVEAGESVLATVVREASEELGIGIDPAQLVPLTTMHRTSTPEPIEQRVDFFFTTRVWSGVPAVQEPAKCAGIGWAALADLPDPVVPHERNVLALLGDRLAGGPAVPAITVDGF